MGLTYNGATGGRSTYCYQAGMSLRLVLAKEVPHRTGRCGGQIPVSVLLATWGHMICHSELVGLALILA